MRDKWHEFAEKIEKKTAEKIFNRLDKIIDESYWGDWARDFKIKESNFCLIHKADIYVLKKEFRVKENE